MRELLRLLREGATQALETESRSGGGGRYSVV